MPSAVPFRRVWAVDFEFTAPPGERPDPICLVAKELRTGQLIRLWRDDFGARPPYDTGVDALVIAYYASAELGCHLALRWPQPVHVLDLCAEFRNLTSGIPLPHGKDLLSALNFFGLDHLGSEEKRSMQSLAMRGGPWTAQEKTDLLDYCQSDVDALARLLPVMLPRIDLPYALLRGRYMHAAAVMEWNGVPIDVATLRRLQRHWAPIQERLIESAPEAREIYDGRTFRAAKFKRWLAARNIAWPCFENGELSLEDNTFAEMADIHPFVRPLYELRHAMGKLRLSDLAVGKDGRNRCLLGAFGAISGRNLPSSAKYIFGPSKWLRGLILPPEGYGLAYLDWQQQEFGIAGALSGDPAMQAAYLSGDPYLAFAKQAGTVPQEATAKSHKAERDLFKSCVLAVQYGMGERSLAFRINRQPSVARELLAAHRTTYPRFWEWSNRAFNQAALTGSLRTVFGWHVHAPFIPKSGRKTGEEINPRSLMNFPMQANGAEMLRLACCFGIRAGVEICAPVHDAVLIAAPIARLTEDIAKMETAMVAASSAILSGFALRTDTKVVRFPGRYMDERGAEMWDRIIGLLEEIEAAEACVAAE
jgi:hypothetical protein